MYKKTNLHKGLDLTNSMNLGRQQRLDTPKKTKFIKFCVINILNKLFMNSP